MPNAALTWPDRIARGDDYLRALLNIDYTRTNANDTSPVPFAFAPSPGASTLILTFAGNVGDLIIQSPFRSRRNVHILALRDRSRRFSLCGIDRFADTYESCRAQIEKISRDAGATRIVVVGVSAGGYSALRYGLDLGAHGVLAFAAPTSLNIADEPGASLARYPQLTALYKTRRELGADMRRAYLDAPARPRVMLFYAPGMKTDAMLARRMEDVPGVALHTVPDEAKHAVYHWMMQKGLVDAPLETLLAMTPVCATAA